MSLPSEILAYITLFVSDLKTLGFLLSSNSSFHPGQKKMRELEKKFMEPYKKLVSCSDSKYGYITRGTTIGGKKHGYFYTRTINKESNEESGLKKACFYWCDMLHGSYSERDCWGESHGCYFRGKRVGYWKVRHFFTTKKGCYLNDKKEGVWTITIDDRIEGGSYHKGVKQGFWEIRYEKKNVLLLLQGCYLNGTREGSWKITINGQSKFVVCKGGIPISGKEVYGGIDLFPVGKRKRL